jgi:hypothetical protein
MHGITAYREHFARPLALGSVEPVHERIDARIGRQTSGCSELFGRDEQKMGRAAQLLAVP